MIVQVDLIVQLKYIGIFCQILCDFYRMGIVDGADDRTIIIKGH